MPEAALQSSEASRRGTLSDTAGALAAGRVLHGRYEIRRLLGAGAMSAVYEARDLRFPQVTRMCAVKEITLTAPASQRSTFERELFMLASLSHPAIPKIYDFFEDGPRNYLVLELIDGHNLESLLTQQGALSERTAVRYAIEVCEVLEYLHARRPEPIIFRDLKPANIMLSTQGRITLVDFGIAKLLRKDVRGTMVGTEGYSPPEQYRGEATPAVDIYALGATLHHLLTGSDPRAEPPFSFQERPVQRYSASVSHEVVAVVERALAYDPAQRFATVSEMRAALEMTQRAGKLALAGRQDAESVEPLWVYECGDEVRASPIVAGGAVFVGCYDDAIYALDAGTGALRWKYATGAGIATRPAVWNDLLLVGSDDCALHALTLENGYSAWTCQAEGKVRSSVRMAYEHAFFGCDDHRVYAVHADSGKVTWRATTAGPVRSTPSIFDETLYVGCEDGYTYAINLQRGGLEWRHYCGGSIASSPLWHEGLIIFGAADRYVYALDTASGWPAWRFRTGKAVISSPALLERTVLIGSADGCLYALEVGAGRLMWKYETGGQVNSSPAASPQAVYFGSTDGYVYSVDPRTGRLRWRFKTAGPVVSSPWLHDGTLYVGSMDGRLYALPA